MTANETLLLYLAAISNTAPKCIKGYVVEEMHAGKSASCTIRLQEPEKSPDYGYNLLENAFKVVNSIIKCRDFDIEFSNIGQTGKFKIIVAKNNLGD